MRLSIRDVLTKAYYFTVFDPYGPWGELGSFRPIKVEFDAETDMWIVICAFKKGGREVKVKIVIEDETGEIIKYEELGG